MSKKRHREEASPEQATSKRPRVDHNLVKIWEALSDENEVVRLNAAHDLISDQLLDYGSALAGQVARRLFRALCSGRKAARLGFYTALVGALSMKPQPFGDATLSLNEVTNILEVETVAESGTSRQDERDHAFGRLLGCKAIIDSGILFHPGEHYLQFWRKILDLQCGVAAKKPWLRQENGWILFNCIQTWSGHATMSFSPEFALTILHKLQENKLVRSPEGIAIWIIIRKSFPHQKLPRAIWKFDNPLAAKDLNSLAIVLKDSKTDEDTEFQAQGSSVWSAKLHFAWQVILDHLFKDKGANSATFEAFWKTVVDGTLFAENSSAERKHIGFLLLQLMVEKAPFELLAKCFTAKTVHSFTYAQKMTSNSNVSHTANVLRAFMLAAAESQPQKASVLVEGLISGSSLFNYDVTSLASLIDKLISFCRPNEGQSVQEFFQKLIYVPGDIVDASLASARRRNLLNLQQRFIGYLISKANAVSQEAHLFLEVAHAVVRNLCQIAYRRILHSEAVPQFEESIVELAKEKVSLSLDAILKAGQQGQVLLTQIVLELESETMSADAAIEKPIQRGWKRLRKFCKAAEGNYGANTSYPTNSQEQGMALLFALVMFQVCNGETGAVDTLEEVLEISHQKHNVRQEQNAADQILEIVLTFVSVPSKFLRHISTLVFEAFSSRITSEGLKSLTAILQTTESRDGQQELFEADLEEDEYVSSGNDESSRLGSDVEVLDNSTSSEVDSLQSLFEPNPDQESVTAIDEVNSGAENGLDASEELEKALALALGTRKLTSTDLEEVERSSFSDTDSDSDMSDSQMMALDEKLSEVFRSQMAQSSSQQTRKQEQKSAKVNVVNFKNRALDMIEIFLRSQHSRSESLEIINPVIGMIRTTGQKQIADRGVQILKQYAQKCKGNKAPSLKDQRERTRTYDILNDLLNLVFSANSSNALIGVGSQMNILICRILVNAGDNLQQVSGKVKTMLDSLRGKKQRKAYDELITSFDNWVEDMKNQ